MSAAIQRPPVSPVRGSFVKHPPNSPLSVVAPHSFDSPTDSTPPISPIGKSSQMQETTDVDRTRHKFGDKSKFIRRMSSTEWENPFSDKQNFAKVSNDDDHFEAKIDLACFAGFSIDEIDVNVYEYDILIHARKDSPNNPNFALSEISRQYRLPDDVDLETVKLQKNKLKNQVCVEAEKIHGYGKPVSYAVVDVTNHDPNIKYIH
ncbi:hypothetical protein FO519_007486 [Halicephalobus sp. NKZ332]|nr:hypothetical protein FO519_007486 [Halicephalobus sp. NKZ332]